MKKGGGGRDPLGPSPKSAYGACIEGDLKSDSVCHKMTLPGLCVANNAPADTEVTRKLLKRSPRNASQRVAAFSKKRAPVFLS